MINHECIVARSEPYLMSKGKGNKTMCPCHANMSNCFSALSVAGVTVDSDWSRLDNDHSASSPIIMAITTITVQQRYPAKWLTHFLWWFLKIQCSTGRCPLLEGVSSTLNNSLKMTFKYWAYHPWPWQQSLFLCWKPMDCMHLLYHDRYPSEIWRHTIWSVWCDCHEMPQCEWGSLSPLMVKSSLCTQNQFNFDRKLMHHHQILLILSSSFQIIPNNRQWFNEWFDFPEYKGNYYLYLCSKWRNQDSSQNNWINYCLTFST